jgi:N-acetylglucosamine-6-phosphate deacetylase
MAVRRWPFPLLDLQVNGYRGLDFSSPDLTLEAIEEVTRAMAAAGTMAYLATLVTAPLPVFERNLALLDEAMTRPAIARHLLGVHLEGPFLSPEPGYIGAHNPDWVRPADPVVMRRLLKWGRGRVRLITVASCLDGAPRLIRAACHAGVVVACGHDAMTADSLRAAARAGATAITHLGNGLPLTLPRHPNPLWAGLGEDALSATLIADGRHLDPAVLRVIVRAKGLERCIVVSDVASIAGQPPGVYEVGGQRAEVTADGSVVKPGTGYLAGSGVLLGEALHRLKKWLELSDEDCRRLAWDNPRQLLGLPDHQLTTETWRPRRTTNQ